MNRKIIMVGKESEHFIHIEHMLEDEGNQVTRLKRYPEYLSTDTDLLLIDYSDIPQDGDDLPQRIPVMGYRYKDQALRRNNPDIEILSEEETSDNEVVRRICERIEEADYARQMVLTYRDLSLDLRTGRISVAGDKVSLSSNEFRILRLLMENTGVVISREQIIASIWGPDSETETKAVEVYISHIREKIDDVYGKTYISTIRGKGYVIGRDRMNQQ